MGIKRIGTVVLAISASFSNADDKMGTVTLYQVGKSGNYCISTNRDTSGCVSGTSNGGNTINVMDLVKGKRVVFENLSDAPHDMKFTGKNAEDLPTQDSGAAPVGKDVQVVDTSNQKITCSFHGDQLAVGYRVLGAPTAGTMQAEGHRSGGPDGNGGGNGNEGAVAPGKAIVRTNLADVSGDVLAKGRPSDVAKLVGARPDLMKQLEQVRPLLAQEIAANGVGGAESEGGGKIAGLRGANTGETAFRDSKAGGELTGGGSPADYKIIGANGFATGSLNPGLPNGHAPLTNKNTARLSGGENETNVPAGASVDGSSPHTRLRVAVRETASLANISKGAESGNSWLWTTALLSLTVCIAVMMGKKTFRNRPLIALARKEEQKNEKQK